MSPAERVAVMLLHCQMMGKNVSQTDSGVKIDPPLAPSINAIGDPE